MAEVKISIIIATRHREQILWETVEKAIEATGSSNAEIIVVNDGDAPLHIPGYLLNHISCFDNPKKGASSARNFGASKAKGEILFFVDDDMWINNEVIDWINSYVIEKDHTTSVYYINWEYPPYLKDKLAETKVGRYLLSANYHNLWGRLHKDSPQPASGFYQYNSLGSGSLVLHEKLFNNAGGYNEKMVFQGEDADLAGKFNDSGVPIFIIFDITLYHNQSDRLEIDSFLRRISNGFRSEFDAVKSGERNTISETRYNGFKKRVLEFSRLTERSWILIFNILPNHSIMTPICNRLIGALGGLQRYKQWKNIN